MRTMIKLALALAAADLLCAQAAGAETLRCGSALIQPGDDADYVLENCGEPESGAPPGNELPSGVSVYRMSIVRADRWRYHRGPGLFPAVVTIAADGRVADIQFERNRD